MNTEPLYSIGTWDTDLQSYSPHPGIPAFNLTIYELRAAMRQLRDGGWYTVHRFGNTEILDRDSDPNVMIERTDGLPEQLILEGWKR